MMNNLLNKKTFNEVLLLLPFVFAFAFMIWFEGASKALVITTVISLLVFVIVFKGEIKSNIANASRKPFHILLWVFSVFVIAQSLLHGVSSREIRAAICLSLIALYFPFQRIQPIYYQSLVVLGCCTIFSNSLYFSVIHGFNREFGVINPIPYASIAALLALLALHFSFGAQTTKGKVIFAGASLFPIISLILTESRGVWLAFICAFLMLSWRLFKFTIKKIIFVSVLVASLITLLSGSFIEQRIEKTQYEFEQIQQGNMNTSIGLRFQMWEASLKLADNNWLVGLGTDHFDKFEQLYTQHQITKALYDLHPPHYHNQFIDSVVKSGLIGLFFLLLLLLLPLYLVRHADKRTKNIVLSVVALYVVMGLTDAPFYNGQTFILYILTMLILINTSFQPTTQTNHVRFSGA